MARLRARRSRYRFTNRLAGPAPAAAIIAVVLVLTVGVASLAAARVIDFVGHVTGGGLTINTATNALGITDAPPGTIPYRIKHKDPTPINLLLLGYGGAENDAPYLTDTMLVARIDPASGRVALISIPRDLYVPIEAWPESAHIVDREKINAAFEAGTDGSGYAHSDQRLPQYRGRDGGGHLAEDTVGRVTGLHFDGYVGVDFRAFRDVVNALGGVDVCLDGPLDDFQYPDYHNGYIPGGIHYKAGCAHYNGEQALQIARSREAIEPSQASDFGRAKRQQAIIAAIRKQALTVGGLTKAPALMDALKDHFKTDLTIGDLTAIYNFGKKVDESLTLHYGLTDANLLGVGGCGPYSAGYILCPDDPSYQMIHAFVALTFPPPPVVTGHAPVEVIWGGNPYYLADGVSDVLKSFSFQVAPPIRARTSPGATVIYDFSNGQFPQTADWLAKFFGATVVTPASDNPAPAFITSNQGFVIYVGHDFGRRWYNCAAASC